MKKKRSYVRTLSLGVAFFILALTVNFFASQYAAHRMSYPVTDIILSNVPVVDVDSAIVYGSLILILITIYEVIRYPRILPFVLKSVALFILIRSIFISLTHLGPFTPQVPVHANSIASLGLGRAADLFFSGHTGMPFLGALIFWENKYLRFLFLISSLILGASVLLGHLHYSIDVFAAFFITYTIFGLAKWFFAEDWKLFNSKR